MNNFVLFVISLHLLAFLLLGDRFINLYEKIEERKLKVSLQTAIAQYCGGYGEVNWDTAIYTCKKVR